MQNSWIHPEQKVFSDGLRPGKFIRVGGAFILEHKTQGNNLPKFWYLEP